MKRRGVVKLAAGGLVAFAVFIGLGLTVKLDGRDVALSHSLAQGDEPPQTVAPQQGKAGRSTLEKLRCFRCHNIERYRHGEDFSHEVHEDVGHCHVCHAFEGHFQAVIRRQVCEDCH